MTSESTTASGPTIVPDGAVIEELAFAMTHVPGFTAACATHGDAATFALLRRYYRLAAEAAAAANGRIVKVIGDATLMTFPIGQLQQAEAVLRRLQADATALLRSFDPRCSVQVKLGVGPLATGPLGPPGDERPDVIGSALNRLVKLPWADVVISPEAAALLAGQPGSNAPRTPPPPG